jgi:ribA/ribD-fused uncharacterized protein
MVGMAQIIIGNLRDEVKAGPHEAVFRVDRKSILGNPYAMRNDSEDERNRVCDLYEKYFKAQIKKRGDFAREVGKIIKAVQDPEISRVYLMCWCAPNRCHGETIKRFVEAYIRKENKPMLKEVKGDIWTLWEKDYEAICITTNGVVKADGTAVMGKGIALQAKERFSSIDKTLGTALKQRGNHVHCLCRKDGKYVLSFPTKNNWRDKSDIELIKQSCTELIKKMDEVGIKTCILPRPGCGNGGLKWEEVKKVIAPLLDERVVVCSGGAKAEPVTTPREEKKEVPEVKEPKEETKIVDRFVGEYAFLSNMYPSRVEVFGKVFRCAEAAFQAAKCKDPKQMASFEPMDGKQARAVGRKIELRSDWNDVRVHVMQHIVAAKFAQNRGLAEKLVKTGHAKLVEGNTWNDKFWGVCDGEGKNVLGLILMSVREKVAAEIMLPSNSRDTVNVCFTGHRPDKLGGYDWSNPVNQKIMARLKQMVSALLNKYEKIRFICGGALGIDQMAFDICHELKCDGMTLELAMPFEKQDAVWLAESKEVLKSQRQRADMVTLVDTIDRYKVSGTKVGEYNRYKLHQRNHYMVDNADLVIAVWDGTAGGTGECVSYARKQGKSIAIVHPRTLAITMEGPALPPRTKGGDE